jgi:3-hydroxy acid dehydrogenase / malonic semialdehyde reductase
MTQNLAGKTVFITGASSGIGRACAEAFAREKCGIMICARRGDAVREFGKMLQDKYGVRTLTFPLDVRKRTDVEKALEDIPSEWKEIDVLVNNAGLSRGLEPFDRDNVDGWDEMIDTNIKGLLYVTKSVVKIMAERKQGHIINIGSIAGHEAYPKGGIYCGTKHAVSAITRSLRMDLLDKNIRVSTVDPGMVETNFSVIRFYGDKEKADNVYSGLTPLTAEDVAETVLYVATRPAHVNIAEVIIMPSAQGSATLTYRKQQEH